MDGTAEMPTGRFVRKALFTFVAGILGGHWVFDVFAY